MTEPATVVFEGGAGSMIALTFEQEGRTMRFVRKQNS